MSDLDLHCAAQTERLGESPAGTAGAADLILLLQLPLPWPNKIDAHPALKSLTPPPGSGPKVQILAIAPAVGESGDPFQIIGYHAVPGHPFGHFERFELTMTADTWLQTVQRLSEGQLPDPQETSASQSATCNNPISKGAPSQSTISRSPAKSEKSHVVDLLICTHGSRDRCCGQSGSMLFLEVDEAVRASEGLANIQVWRTSHIGGHRFAPTALTLPDGMTWANLDCETTIGILRRSLDTKTAGQHLRGTVGLAGGPVQIADGIAFSEIGWSWLDHDRRPNVATIPIGSSGFSDNQSGQSGQAGSLTRADPGARQPDERQPDSRTSTESPSIKTATVSSAIGSITVVLKPAPSLPVPPCGEPLDQATKSVPQWEITSTKLTRL